MEGLSLDDPPQVRMAEGSRRALLTMSKSPRRKNVLLQLLREAAAPGVNRVCLDRLFLEKGFIWSDLLSQNLFATQGPQWD